MDELHKELILNVRSDGTIISLYDEFIDSFEGEKNIQRASEVEFNDKIQKWVIEIKVGPFKDSCLLKTFENRKDALMAEVAFFNSDHIRLTGERNSK